MAKPDAGNAKKIIDVTNADESVAEDSSKPIIVTNRPVIKDPMVTAPTAAELITKQTAARKEPLKSKGVKIEPLGAPPLPSDDKPAKKAEDEGKLADAPDLPIETADGKDEKAVEPKQVKSKKEKPEPEPEPEAEPTKEPPVEEKPAAEEKPAQEAEKPAGEPPEDEKAPPEEPADQPETGEKTEKPGEDKKTPAEKAATAEQAKQAEQVEKLVESRRYNLPINSIEKRRSKRFVALGIILSVLLALVWLDIALDAGLIHINNIQPLTHFFST